VPRLTIRLNDSRYDRLIERAGAAGIAISVYLRDLLDRDLGADPGGYHARLDEVHATTIQVLAILAASVAHNAPELLEQGMADARELLRERGLLAPEDGQ
jgi:RHH-type transcriptional regulator, rel operon repressor / antitoxin RelB